MRINKYIAQSTGMSRRKADETIADGRVLVNGKLPEVGQQIKAGDIVEVDGNKVEALTNTTTIVFNKPAGVICSKVRQDDTPTIYELLPEDLKDLKTIGRLDKNSRGLLLLTNDGDLAQRLTHPKYKKEKVYQVKLDKELASSDKEAIENGIDIEEYISQLQLKHLGENSWQVTMTQGRNRQIRRTFETLGYKVVDLLRVKFGEYRLGDLKEGKWQAAPRS
ncbi:MAG: pseudouridine synthase [Candidatus Saccharimonadales bacterium]